MRPDVQILLWGLGFLAAHLVLSHPPIRRPLVDKLGEMPFRGLYSVPSALTMGGLIYTWWTHRHAGELLFLARGPVATHGAELLVVVGFALLAAGGVLPTPSSMTFRGEVDPDPRGIVALTRHPVNMGIALVAVAHMLVNGWTADLAFWGSLLALCLLGTLHEDYRKRREKAGYAELCERTTWLPVPRPSTLGRVGARAWMLMAAGAVSAVVLRVFHAPLFSS